MQKRESVTTKYHEQTSKMSWAQPVHIVPKNMFHKQARDITLRQDVDPCLTSRCLTAKTTCITSAKCHNHSYHKSWFLNSVHVSIQIKNRITMYYISLSIVQDSYLKHPRQCMCLVPLYSSGPGIIQPPHTHSSHSSLNLVSMTLKPLSCIESLYEGFCLNEHRHYHYKENNKKAGRIEWPWINPNP